MRKKTEVGIVLNPQNRYFQIPELYAGIVVYDSGAEDASRIIAIGNDELTTNCVEGFHNALNSMFLCKHPTVWRFTV